jgi:hypothetical protein
VQVISVNHFPQVYTILAPGEEYTQCNCAWVDQRHICKHAMKVYKMIYPKVEDAAIIRRQDSLHETSAARYDIDALDSFRSRNLFSGNTVPKCGTGAGPASEDIVQAL